MKTQSINGLTYCQRCNPGLYSDGSIMKNSGFVPSVDVVALVVVIIARLAVWVLVAGFARRQI